MTVNGGGFSGRNLPELRETAEMIKADEVTALRCPTQPLHPPLVALGTHRIPVIKRISPALAGGAVCIRRHAGNRIGIKVILQTEQSSICPYVGAVVIHKDGNISDHAYGFLRAVETQGMPLLVEKELDDPANSCLRGEFQAGSLQRNRIAPGQPERPGVPRLSAIAVSQGVV